jgi:transcriptional regulator with PAS, ATPase and Fis domain
MTVKEVKQRFGIIGNSPLLDIAINTAMQVAPTDITVLIYGESGVGKEAFPQIIHQLSSRKHGTYISINCGAIPEGTIDSELFGHEKGSFTGAHEARKGYFEVANGGTIFLDEVADLPLSTQVRLLRVLESGEFFKVGSSKGLKTDVRVVAATNINILESIQNGKFREDLYYRLSTVPINIPPLRNRQDDIYLLFRKFASDFAEKYRMPAIELDGEAQHLLLNYYWPGNIRQLKNVTEQLSILEKNRQINVETLTRYLPTDNTSKLPVLFNGGHKGNDFSERDLLYKVLFDMRKDMNDLKQVVGELIQNGGSVNINDNENAQLVKQLYHDINAGNGGQKTIPIEDKSILNPVIHLPKEISKTQKTIDEHNLAPEKTLTLEAKSAEYVKSVLLKNNGEKRKTARDLGISERTLYRYIIDYNLENMVSGKRKK